jgi:Ca2+/Na+ antiporter
MAFEGLGLIGNSLILLVSIIVVIVASEVTINNSVKVSNMFGFGKTTVGFILLGFANLCPNSAWSFLALAKKKSASPSATF